MLSRPTLPQTLIYLLVVKHYSIKLRFPHFFYNPIRPNPRRMNEFCTLHWGKKKWGPEQLKQSTSKKVSSRLGYTDLSTEAGKWSLFIIVPDDMPHHAQIKRAAPTDCTSETIPKRKEHTIYNHSRRKKCVNVHQYCGGTRVGSNIATKKRRIF